ncbi:MAG: NAD(+) kinase [Nitrospirae bacterium]|nr:MAG: NAD(+) kinase [Nitrospirota bacterium]
MSGPGGPPRVRRIGVICKPRAEFGPQVTELLVWIQHQGRSVLVERAVAPHFPSIPAAPREELFAECDVILVLGGDGTLLGAAREAAVAGLPVLGVNLGSLGFLTGTPFPEARTLLSALFAGRVRLDERLLLTAEVVRAGRTVARHHCLNDAVINKGALARVVSIDVSVDGRFLTTFRADGLILSTPTGSTAYCMAAGGPILTPGLACLALVPICPHTLTHRPLVLSADAEVVVTLEADHQDLHLTVDGQEGIALETGDRVVVRRSEHTVRLVHDPAYDYYALLRTKLGWGSPLQGLA